MMKQYFELKPQDAVLFFRMGDFYEIFGDDALEVAPKLDLQLANRSDPNKIPFCGVPHHAVEQYIQKLLKLGYKLAIAEQIEDPKEAKGLVKRDIVRTLTPGAQLDVEGDANFLMGIFEDPKTRQFQVALADISSGDLRCGLVSSKEDVLSLVSTFEPREILIRQFIINDFFNPKPKNIRLTAFSESALRIDSPPWAWVKQRFAHPCSYVLAGIMDYFERLQLPIQQFLCVRELYEKDYFTLHSTTVRDLELFTTIMQGEKKGSFLHEINRTRTPMGRQTLFDFVLRPLKNPTAITERLNQVELFLGQLEFRKELSRIADLRRIRTKIINSRAQPQDLIRLLGSLEAIDTIAPSVPTLRQFDIEKLRHRLNDALSLEDFGTTPRILKSGYCERLDHLYNLAQNGEKALNDYESELKLQTGIPSLKIKTHHSYGLLVEVTKVHLDKVPSHFIRKQTMVAAERFLTEELIELHTQLSEAEAAAKARESELFKDLVDFAKPFQSQLWELAQHVAEVDVLSSFAQLAKERQLVRPQTSEHIRIRGSRHLVVESVVGTHRFISNDINIESTHNTVVITGPNMAGKSTFMRQLALSALLHQMGCYVPAVNAELPVFDGIFTRLGAFDDLNSGQSTFLVEMNEASTILRHATSQSLVIVDEIGRGTSTQDGLALAEAILRDLHDRIRCFCLFSTHYHELIPRVQDLHRLLLLHASVSHQADGTVCFSHVLEKGVCSSSYGIEVAKMAGLPEHVIRLAADFLTNSLPEIPDTTSSIAPRNLSPKTEWHGVEKIKQLNINRLTPLQALKILDELHTSLIHPLHQPDLFPFGDPSTSEKC